MDMMGIFLGIFLFGSFGYVLYVSKFHPERELKARLNEIERKLWRLRKRDRLAKIITWMDAPYLHGDVDRYILLLEQRKHILKRELLTYDMIRRGENG